MRVGERQADLQSLPWRGQPQRKEPATVAGGKRRRRSPHLELNPRESGFPEPQGGVAPGGRQEAEATQDPAFAPTGPPATSGEAGEARGEVVHRALVRAQPCPPGDWPGSEVGGGVQRLRPGGWALLCVLPGIYWVY